MRTGCVTFPHLISPSLRQWHETVGQPWRHLLQVEGQLDYEDEGHGTKSDDAISVKPLVSCSTTTVNRDETKASFATHIYSLKKWNEKEMHLPSELIPLIIFYGRYFPLFHRTVVVYVNMKKNIAQARRLTVQSSVRSLGSLK